MATDVGNYDGYYYSYHDQPKLPRARELIIIDFHYYIINSKDNFVHSSNEFDSWILHLMAYF